MGASASTATGPPSLVSSPLNLCSNALGNGGAGSQATLLPETNSVVVFGGGANLYISHPPPSCISARLNGRGGPLPTIEGHTITGVSGRRAVLLGGLSIGRRSSGFAGGFSNTNPEFVSSPAQQPVKTSFSSGYILHVSSRRGSGGSLTGLAPRRSSAADVAATNATWTRKQFLGQPPHRRAYHSAHRVMVGGQERIVIYGGEVGSMLSRPSSVGSNISKNSARQTNPDDADADYYSAPPTEERELDMSLPSTPNVNPSTPLRYVSPVAPLRSLPTAADAANISLLPTAAETANISLPLLSPMHLNADGNLTLGRKPFDEADDDDGFLYVLDTSSWIWTSGTCASETSVNEARDRGEAEITSSRSFFPPARARHTATPVTDEGVFTILFGGYKTKQTSHPMQTNNYGDHTYSSGIGQPLNDAWSLKTIGGGKESERSVRFIWRRLNNLGAPPSGRWGHVAVSIGSGAMVVFGGCCEAVDLTKDRSGVNSIQSALEDCYVFHLGGDLGFTDVTTYSGEVAEGDGLWVRVPGDSGLGLGRRVCPAAAVTSGGIMIFGGCRGKDDEEEKPGIFARGEGGDKKMLKDARIVAVKGMLNLNLAT